ncbi:MAG: mechanosensitive ion channel [Rhodothermia bacterium]|nr:MAG: mechanosensitive ion channel [Rhodothermia bacterium]
MQDFLQNELVRNTTLVGLILVSVVVLVRIIQRLIGRFVKDPERIFRASRNVRRVGVFIAAITVVVFFSPASSDVLILLTVIGAGAVIALRDVLLSIAGWIKISVLSSFREGDRVEINGVQGDVIDIRMMRTTLMEIGGWVDADQSTGRLVHIPNSWIFEHAVYNYSRSFNFIWNEFPITITFSSDWQAARDIMLGFAEESAAIVEQEARKEIHKLSKDFLVHYSILTPFVYVRVVENGIRLTLRYLCDVRKRRGTEHALAVSVLDSFMDHGSIAFAYPALHISSQQSSLPSGFSASSKGPERY